MNRDTARAINREFKELRERPGTPHKAVVSSVSPLKVQLAGVPIELTATRLNSYSPVVDDVVYVTMGMGPVLIHDKIGGDSAVARLATDNTFTAALTIESDTEVISEQNPTSASAVIPAGTPIFEVDGSGNLTAGPNELLSGKAGNHSGDIPDLLYAADTRRVLARTLILSEVGDPPDLAMQRAGNPTTSTTASVTLPQATIPVVATEDAFASSGQIRFGGQMVSYTGKTSTSFTGCTGGTGTHGAGTTVEQISYPAGTPTGVLAGTALGSLYWRGWITPTGEEAGVKAGGSFQTRSAEIFCRAAEDIFDNNSGGNLGFATTPIGGGSSIERVTILHNGKVGFGTTEPTQGIIQLAESVADTAGIAWGTDARLWRSAPGVLKSNASLHMAGDLIVRDGDAANQMRLGSASLPGLLFGEDEAVRLHRDGSGALRTDAVFKCANAWTANADAAVNGYVTMEVNGTVRKLATIA